MLAYESRVVHRDTDVECQIERNAAIQQVAEQLQENEDGEA